MLAAALRIFQNLDSPGEVLVAGLVVAVPYGICVIFTALTMAAGRSNRASGVHPALPWRTVRRTCLAMCVATLTLALVTVAPVIYPSESDVPDAYFWLMCVSVVLAALCTFYFVVNIIIAGSAFRAGAGPEEEPRYRRIMVIAPVATVLVILAALYLQHGLDL